MLTQLISEVGFPMAMCCIMCWFYFKVIKNLEATLVNNTKALEKHGEMLEKISQKLDG